MNDYYFLGQREVVEKPCKEVLSYPLQCFQEMFLATPAVVGTFFVGIGGFVIAVIIWSAIFALALFAIAFLLTNLYRATKYFFTSTKVGQKIASLIPMQKCLHKFFCKAQEVQNQKSKDTQAINEGFGTSIVSKVSIDSNWFKHALKHVAFGKSTDSDHSTSDKSPSKTPQRSTSRISALTPKILSPKTLKQ